MLHHTSGLRDWGSVAWIAGASRGTRAYTHAHVLDILSRQEALNFTPGTRWSYSNSGYNLSAILVSRVAGEPFAEFTRKRLFEPLGMTRTSWRDDYTRVVKDRAVAYVETDGRYTQDMPFENVHGNGGLLTTVGDLLRWNANFDAPQVGDAAWVRLIRGARRATPMDSLSPVTRDSRKSGTAARRGATAPTSHASPNSACPLHCCAMPATACRGRRCMRSPTCISQTC
jgi:CubicO group peptidase (beta-lactamase class C family)